MKFKVQVEYRLWVYVIFGFAPHHSSGYVEGKLRAFGIKDENFEVLSSRSVRLKLEEENVPLMKLAVFAAELGAEDISVELHKEEVLSGSQPLRKEKVKKERKVPSVDQQVTEEDRMLVQELSPAEDSLAPATPELPANPLS